MSWDGFQREALAELGYRLYRPAGSTPPASPSHPLQLALLRAAGRTVDDADAARLCQDWPPPHALRDPAAKRALWPRLRALRRRTR